MNASIDSLRIATYNIHKGVQGLGPRQRLEIHNLGHAIEQLDADIVCLQEVRKVHRRQQHQFTHWPDLPQADFLAPEGYEAVYRTNAVTRSLNQCLVELAARLFRRTKAAIRQHGLDIFTRVACQRDFQIVNRRRAVHRKRGGHAARGEVEQQRRKPALDHMPANTPHHRFARLPRIPNRIGRGAK